MNWKKDLENTPSSISCWCLEQAVETELEFGEDVSIYLISEQPKISDNLEDYSFNFDFIDAIISDLDSYYIKAINYIKEKLEKDSLQFGISHDKATEMIRLDTKEFPVEFPSVVFYDDNSWMIRFADADFPVINYGHGIAVFFIGMQVRDMEILPEEPEIIE